MTATATLSRCAALIAAALLLACSSEDPAPNPAAGTAPASRPAAATGTPLPGKLVATADPAVSLIIPPDSLPAGVTAEALKVTPAKTTGPDAAVTSPAGHPLLAYNLEPSGTTFAKPINVRFNRVPDRGSVPLAYLIGSDGKVEVVSGVSAELNAGTGTWTVTVPVTHFSIVALDREGIFRATLTDIDPMFVGQRFSTSLTVERVRGAISVLQGGYTIDGKYVNYRREYGTRGTWNFGYGSLGALFSPWDGYEPAQVDAPGENGPVLKEDEVYRKTGTYICKQPGFHYVQFNSQIYFSSVGTLSHDGTVVERYTLDHAGNGELNGKQVTGEFPKWTFLSVSAPASCYGLPGTALATVPPGTTPYEDDPDYTDLDPNRLPVVAEISASLSAPVTTYSVTATDPDNNPLTYTWSMVGEECGTPKTKWTQQGATVRWSHSDQPPDGCHHTGTNHQVIATVLISDGRAVWECGITGSETLKVSNPACRLRSAR